MGGEIRAGLAPWVGDFISGGRAGRARYGWAVFLLGRAGNSGEDAPFSFFSRVALALGEMPCLHFLPFFFSPGGSGWFFLRNEAIVRLLGERGIVPGGEAKEPHEKESTTEGEIVSPKE